MGFAVPAVNLSLVEARSLRVVDASWRGTSSEEAVCCRLLIDCKGSMNDLFCNVMERSLIPLVDPVLVDRVESSKLIEASVDSLDLC